MNFSFAQKQGTHFTREYVRYFMYFVRLKTIEIIETKITSILVYVYEQNKWKLHQQNVIDSIEIQVTVIKTPYYVFGIFLTRRNLITNFF